MSEDLVDFLGRNGGDMRGGHDMIQQQRESNFMFILLLFRGFENGRGGGGLRTRAFKVILFR